MKIGFVGLGRMGLPMARNLLRAGHDVTVFSHTAEAVEALVAEGARLADSVAGACREVEVLCSCRVTPEQSREVFTGPQGALDGGRPGLLCIDFATVDPMTSRAIGSDLATRGIGFLDAPVSGGPGGAAEATLTVMVGGTPDDFARAQPLLAAIGRTIFLVGPPGAGVAAKLCNNLVTGTMHVLLAEAMVLGVKAGIEPARLYEIMRASSARSNTLERVMPNHFLPRNYEASSALSMIIKDLECAIGTAKALGVRLLLPTVAQQCFVEAEGLGYGDNDLAAVILPMETIAGIEVGPG